MQRKKVAINPLAAEAIYCAAQKAVVASGGYSGHPPPKIIGISFTLRTATVDASGVLKGPSQKPAEKKKKKR